MGDRGSRLAYMVSGSHNLRKAAWGELVGTSRLHIRHYELSVLLLPSLEQVLRFRLLDFCSCQSTCIHSHPAQQQYLREGCQRCISMD